MALDLVCGKWISVSSGSRAFLIVYRATESTTPSIHLIGFVNPMRGYPGFYVKNQAITRKISHFFAICFGKIDPFLSLSRIF
jgi:hypothetical protein